MNEYKEIMKSLAEVPCAAFCRRWSGTEGKLCEMERKLVRREELICMEEKEKSAEVMLQMAEKALLQGVPACGREGDAWEMAEPFFQKERLIILGGGHVALPVAEFAARIGFLVTVVDDRLSFANPGRFPMAEQVICDGFEHAIETLAIRETDYVVIVTRGHRHDGLCLRAIGRGKEPAYLGMIGSRRRVGFVKEALLAEGYDAERLSRLKSPIGLKIGAVTPEEIAISILAEVIGVKRLSGEDKRVKNRSDLDFGILKTLAEETDVPKAVVTVISSHGSSPRGAGAKMLVYRDGRIAGSIGGGCSEAAVLGEARPLIGTGRFKVVHIDMTAEAAEEEGMVCGGVMDALIEDY